MARSQILQYLKNSMMGEGNDRRSFIRQRFRPKHNFMRKKIITLLSIVLTLALVTTGCGVQSTSNVPVEHKASPVTADKLKSGIYVFKHKTNKYIKLYDPFEDMSANNDNDSSYSSNTEETTSQNFIWEAYSDKKIPTLEKGDKLVYKSTKTAPYPIALTPISDYGYTVGVSLYYNNNDGTWCIPTDSTYGYCSNSTFAQEITDHNYDPTSSTIRVSDIGGTKITSKLVSNIGTIKGLKINKSYKLGLYQGTVYKQITVKPDTHVWALSDDDSSVIVEDYSFTHKGYVIANLPKKMINGYYYIYGVGLFKYKAGISATSKNVSQAENSDTLTNADQNQ